MEGRMDGQTDSQMEMAWHICIIAYMLSCVKNHKCQLKPLAVCINMQQQAPERCGKDAKKSCSEAVDELINVTAIIISIT